MDYYEEDRWKVIPQPPCDCEICVKMNAAVAARPTTTKNQQAPIGAADSHSLVSHNINLMVDLSLIRVSSGVPVELRVIIHQYLAVLLNDTTIRDAVTNWNIYGRKTVPELDRSNRALYGRISERSGRRAGLKEQMEHSRVLFTYGHISFWDTSKVTDMSNLFGNRYPDFNDCISHWDVDQVTNMREMFACCHFFDCPLTSWQVNNVTIMMEMFRDAKAFNQPLSTWNVSRVKDMSGMFRCALVFNQDISNWDVSSVEDMNNLFYFAKAFNQSLANWNMQRVVNISWMFAGGNRESIARHELVVQSYNERNIKAAAPLDVLLPIGWDLRSAKYTSHAFDKFS